MKKLDLNKTLRTILLVLAIVLMLIKLINKASAESLDDYYDQIKSTYFANISSSNISAIESVISDWNLKYFLILKQSGTAGSFDNGGNVVLIFTDVDNIYLPHYVRYPAGSGTINLTYNSTGSLYTAFNQNSSVSVYSDYTDNPYTGSVHGLVIWQDYNGNPWCGKFTYEFNNGVASNYHYYSVGSITSGNSNYSNAVTASNYLSCGNYYAFSPVTSGGSTAFLESFFSTASYTDTGFFNIWTSISQSDNKMLNITWDSSVFPSSGSMNYVKSVMDLTIEVNGTAQVVSFDSDENPELFPTSSGTYIPYKFLQKVADLAEVSPSDSFYLTMVSLTQYAYPAGAPSSSAAAYNETSLCSVDLGEIQVDVPAVTPVADIPISETNIVDTTFFSNIVGGSVSPAIDYPVPGWANHIQVAVGENPSAPYDLYLSWGYLEEISTQILSMDFSFGSGSSLVGASAELVTEYFKNLDYGALFQKLSQDYLLDYADIVTFDCYNLDSSNNAYIVKRIVIYTDSYFYKMQLQSLGSIQDMIQANTYYTKAIYDYATVRFDGMAQSLEKLRIYNNSLLGSINANIINLQGLVSSGIDRIVNAIQGISGGGLSVSDLSGTLNTLFMPSFEWDTVNYQDYLDSLGVLALPFEFVFDTQSIIKNNYSSAIVLPINDFYVPLGKDFNDNDIQFTVFEDQENFEYDPTDIFPSALWSVFQYLAAFGLVIGEAWFTYVHIFRKEEKTGDF